MALGKKRLEAPKFLSGWKDISSYLGKGVRTVQRYERELGLPVRRPASKSRAAVVATKIELDAWIQASPYRDTFTLPRLTTSQETVTADIRRGMNEMRRLRHQMFDLREEMKRAVAVLRDSIETVHNEVHHSQGGERTEPASNFALRRNPITHLAGSRVDGKAS
jgi:hypothetical protein